jgi:hypothetical protein
MALRPGSARKLAPLALTALLFACAAGQVDAPEPRPLLLHETVAAAEVAAWEADRGPLKGCRLELPAMAWRVVPQAEVGWHFTTSKLLIGCFTYELDHGEQPSTPTVWLAGDVEDADAWTPERHLRLWRHELTHWLLHCSGADPTGDPMHAGPYWAGLL